MGENRFINEIIHETHFLQWGFVYGQTNFREAIWLCFIWKFSDCKIIIL